MNIDEIEAGLNKYGVDTPKLLPAMLQLQIENNALLHVILQNQASHIKISNPDFDKENFIKKANEEAEANYTDILLRLLKKM